MGLTLIHGKDQPSAKPRVIVVAEPSVHAALTSDLELDVYPECFDYDSFVKASLSKSISTNNSIIVVSDSLSQRVAPLEAVIALVRSNIILIPWKSTETEIGQLNVTSCSPRPTPNTLRRAIFQHSGMNDLPPRFDGDEYIEEPPNAGIVSFSPRPESPEDLQYKPFHSFQTKKEPQAQTHEENQININNSTSPLEWFADPQSQQNLIQEPAVENVNTQDKDTLSQQAYLPPIEQQRIEEEHKQLEKQQIEEQARSIDRTASAQEDAPSFLPEFFTPSSQESNLASNLNSESETITQENHVQSKGNICAFWNDEIAPVFERKVVSEDQLEQVPHDSQHPQAKNLSMQDSAKLAETEKWISQAFSDPGVRETNNENTSSTFSGNWNTSGETNEPSQALANNSTSSFDHPTPASEHPYAQGDSLELEAYIDDGADMGAYEVEDTSPSTFVPDVAFAPIDDNGSQQMWTMFDTKMEPASTQQNNLLSEFPDGTDHRKAIHLAEPLTVCVYSPKGGVGKTSISVNLAARLAYTTRLQVCIVDLDIAFGNVGTRLGLYNPTVRELLNESHIDGESIARNLVYDRRSGLFALLAPLRPETGTNRRKFSPAAYKKILGLLRERFDVVLLDCPVELRDPLVSGFALTQASQVVMVVNNEQATLLDARRAIEAMCRPKDSQRLPGLGLDPHNVGLVVNQKVDNVGREVEDIKAILGGGDPNHPSREIEILQEIQDDRHLWVGNANMARTVATSGENDVDKLLDDIWSKVLPGQAGTDFETQEFNPNLGNPLDEIFSVSGSSKPKKKRKMNLFKKNE